jgi:hypothetical protein
MTKSIFINEKSPNLAQLIEQGIRLWHEEAALRPKKKLEQLWLVASEFMDKDLHRKRSAALEPHLEEARNKLQNSIATQKESLRMMAAFEAKLLITNGDIFPETWKSEEQYPHQGLFISAFYFLEAKNFLEDARTDDAWASMTEAYYYMGTNSPLTLSAYEGTRRAAKSKHSENNKALRNVVVTILADLHQDSSIRTKIGARKRVIDAIEKNQNYYDVLEEFSSHISVNTLHSNSREGGANTIIERFTELLKVWSETPLKRPDIYAAFEPFKRGKRTLKTKSQ